MTLKSIDSTSSARLVLVGPPDAGALHLARRVDPGTACGVFPECHGAESPCRGRLPRVREVNGIDLTRLQGLGKTDEDGAELSLELERHLAKKDLVHTEGRMQVELDPGVVFEHPKPNQILAADRLLFRIDATSR